MRFVIGLALALLLVLAIVPTSALAANDTPDTAIVLTAESGSHADQLVGSTGGAVRFYRVDHPGGGLPVRIQVTTSPGRSSAGSALGVKVYGPVGLVGEAPEETNEGTWTRFSMTVAYATPGAFLIQVYNYTNGMAVDFNIQVSGLPATVPPTEPTAAPDGAGETQPVVAPPAGAATQEVASTPIGSSADRPIPVLQRTSNIGGSLAGKSDGSAQYFTFDYPGGATNLVISLKYSPQSPFANNAVGFNLYRGDLLVAQGSETLRDGSSATVSHTLIDDAGGVYLLQLTNYQEGLLANYVLTIEGAAGQVVEVTGNDSPQTAFVLSGSAPSVRGSIGPGREATFNFFLLPYPGDNREVTLRLVADHADGIAEGQIGFSLYKGADLSAKVLASRSSRGDKWLASYSIVEGGVVTFGVQLFNYSTSAPARYTLYVTGL